MRSKKPVWLLFKVLELVLSFCCCYIHWRCFQDEGIPHNFLLCTSYGGSSIICVLSIVGMFYAEKPTMKLESVFSGLLGTLHLVTIFVHMYLALHGQKLLSMKAQGESWHGFYVCCRDNSKVALYATAVYYLHCTFAMDLLLTHTAKFVECPDGTVRKRPRHPRRSMRPLKLYFISIGAENYLNRFRWFHLLTANMLMSTHPSQKTLDASSNSNEELELAQQ
ncbi:uncharacterized protein LOC111080594 [Drosophila obscura]|uniref:uncharacterized protein LOC111080594 n=1 Tax=Drosophila obscura TaxID=7282 RepID=UPI001BB19B15|nr:uncharacterized protein LOC111080594 [Drosophila obscura]